MLYYSWILSLSRSSKTGFRKFVIISSYWNSLNYRQSRFPGLFQHSGLSRGPIVFLPQQVPAFISRGTTHHTDARDLYQRRRELPPNFASRSEFYKDPAGIFYMLQSWDMGHIILFLLRRKAYWGFFGCPKNPTASAGFEPANSDYRQYFISNLWVCSGSDLTWS
jgi:hypothetical protein